MEFISFIEIDSERAAQQSTQRSPDATLKLPAGHDAHAPADAPPQPLRYWPATHDEAEQLEQTSAPEPSMSRPSRAGVFSLFVSTLVQV